MSIDNQLARMTLAKSDKSSIAGAVKSGGIGIMPTDTIYGLVGQAQDKTVVERIYRIKGRSQQKPLIILISQKEQVFDFDVDFTQEALDSLDLYWPGPNTLILPCESDDWHYLHRGRSSLAFRLPRDEWLRAIIDIAGPLVAPSANPQSKQPAGSITQAYKYFGAEVDFYIDGGDISSEPSQLFCYENGSFEAVQRNTVSADRD